MRILHLEAGRHFYGGARQAGYLIDALARRGIDNTLICRAGQPLGGHVAATVVRWPLHGDGDVSLYWRLKRFIEDSAADVVHVHSRRGADTFGGFAARAAACPAILTRRVQSPEPRAWLRFKCRPYAAIAAISRAVHDELTAAGIARARLHLIPSAVDTSLFRPDPEARQRLLARYDLPDTALIVGAAGQFVPRKQQGMLLPLVQSLLAEEPALRLMLFGRGPTRRGLEQRVAALGLGDRIRFCGFASDWPTLVPGLDLLLHPARREGLGSVVLEGMSAGVPVVASAVGGIVDAIDDGVDGLLVPAGSPGQWHARLLPLLRDPAERARLGAAARRKVESAFTIERMTESYLALYQAIMHGR